MSDPMSERELGEIRGLMLAGFMLHPEKTLRLLAEIDRQRELMKEAADEIHASGFGANWCCRPRQHALTADDIMNHAPDCIVSRLRTAGEGWSVRR